MSNPEIATILEDGTYGQRPMTDEEYAQHLNNHEPLIVREHSGRPNEK